MAFTWVHTSIYVCYLRNLMQLFLPFYMACNGFPLGSFVSNMMLFFDMTCWLLKDLSFYYSHSLLSNCHSFSIDKELPYFLHDLTIVNMLSDNFMYISFTKNAKLTTVSIWAIILTLLTDRLYYISLSNNAWSECK